MLSFDDNLDGGDTITLGPCYVTFEEGPPHKKSCGTGFSERGGSSSSRSTAMPKPSSRIQRPAAAEVPECSNVLEERFDPKIMSAFEIFGVPDVIGEVALAWAPSEVDSLVRKASLRVHPDKPGGSKVAYLAGPLPL